MNHSREGKVGTDLENLRRQEELITGGGLQSSVNKTPGMTKGSMAGVAGFLLSV